MSSQDGTRVSAIAVATFAPVVFDSTDTEWRLASASSGLHIVYRGGVATNGRGSEIWWLGGKIWIKGRNGNWWEALPKFNSWRDTGSSADPIVIPPPPVPPTITGMTATPATLPIGGGDVTINATVTGATSLTLDGAAVMLPVVATITTSHSFTLIATNSAGSAAALASVTVATRPPPPPSTKYRNAQLYLFQTVRSLNEPNRIPGGSPFANESTGGLLQLGPNAKFVAKTCGWAWDRVGGDFLDKNLARNPLTPVPWFSIPTNAVSGNTATFTYHVDVTAAEQYIQQQDRWNALLLVNGASTFRDIATTFSSTPPSIAIVYADGTSEVLRCRLVALNSTSTEATITTLPAVGCPCFTEFERPARAVASAILEFTVTAHWSGPNPNVTGYVIDPPMNADPVALGISSAFTLDAGLETEPSVIGVHRYVDGTEFNDFAVPPPGPTDGFPVAGGGYDTSNEAWFDPAIFGNGATDLGKLPHFGLGKWINTNVPAPPDPAGYRSHWDLVRSDYVSDDGFVPLAPDTGAMRIMMRGDATIVDGSAEFSSQGHETTYGVIYLPEPLWGIDELFIGYYLRLGLPFPYTIPMERRKQVIVSGGTPSWTEFAGKTGIMPSHDTTYGGFSGSAGAGYGWQWRGSWSDTTQDDVGPDLGGIHISLHTFDFNYKNPPGYNIGSTDTMKETGFGQRGGLGGILYGQTWYCMEHQLKLNSINPADAGYIDVPASGAYGPWGFVPNGEARQWIDGRLVLERTGLVLRTNPIYDPGYKYGTIRPIRNLGHRNLLLNIFHGGKTINTVDRSFYISGLAWGTKYIGPMAGVTT